MIRPARGGGNASPEVKLEATRATKRAKLAARARAEKHLNRQADLTTPDTIAICGRRIGWALLDVADGLRDVAAAIRETKTPEERGGG